MYVKQVEMHGRTRIVWSRDGSTHKGAVDCLREKWTNQSHGSSEREPISRASLSMEERWRKSEDGPIMETWERTSGFSKRDE